MDTQALAQQAEDATHECEESEEPTDDENVAGDDEPSTPIKPHSKLPLPSESEGEEGDEKPKQSNQSPADALEADQKPKRSNQRDADKDRVSASYAICLDFYNLVNFAASRNVPPTSQCRRCLKAWKMQPSRWLSAWSMKLKEILWRPEYMHVLSHDHSFLFYFMPYGRGANQASQRGARS